MQNQEIWKPVHGFEGYYEVSNLGQVRSLSRIYYSDYFRNGRNVDGKILRQTKNKITGYMSVMLSKDGIRQRCHVHRLVAIAFLPNPNNLPQVNHKDQVRENNSVDNLEWCDVSYNTTYADAVEKHREGFLKSGYAKRIYQYTEDGELVGEYRNGEEAARATGLNGRNIRYATKGIGSLGYSNEHKYRGYIWLTNPL